MSAMDDDDLLRKVAAELGRTIEEAREQVRIAREIREQAQLKLSMTDEEWREFIKDARQRLTEAEAFGLDLMTYIEMSEGEGRA